MGRQQHPHRLELTELVMLHRLCALTILGLSFVLCTAIHLDRGTADRAHADDELLERAASLASNPAINVRIKAHRALRAAMAGRLDEAKLHWNECSLFAGQQDMPELEDLCWPAMIFPLAARGELHNLRPKVHEAMDRRPWALLYRALYAWVCVETGEVAEARFYYERAWAALDRVERGPFLLPYAAALTAVCCNVSDRDRASRLGPLLVALVGRRCAIEDLACFGTIDYHLGRLCQTVADPDSAIAHLEQAVSLDLHAGARIAGTLSRLALAEALATRGESADLARAEKLVVDVREQVVALELRRLEERCAGLEELLAPKREGAPRAGTQGDAFSLLPEVSTVPSRSEPDTSSGSAVPNHSGQNSEASVTSFILRRDGDYWIASRGNHRKVIKHVSGLLLIEHMLNHPAERFHVLELERLVKLPRTAGGFESANESDLGPAIDARAENSYSARIRELQQELDESRRANDLGRVETLENELEFIARELSRALGLHGRPRRAGSRVERARLRITSVIRRAIRYVDNSDTALGYHLKRAIRTGTYCCYLPDLPVEAAPRPSSTLLLDRLSGAGQRRKRP